nr:immunoglobulin heavy chain junction region [Macaca mulatta]MOW19068.1 immunoglobulin heavy chain junction region [Macaca mulatta]MOW19103.1 immunoglobulin heavy chain junction region [Macaca mulatta]MOW19240.1 immunoglobulin heavy chain junction region [Macaca mulatta]MOW19267.1 immunoglobulin heavy chain junction region [Macaca mulatta]
CAIHGSSSWAFDFW